MADFADGKTAALQRVLLQWNAAEGLLIVDSETRALIATWPRNQIRIEHISDSLIHFYFSIEPGAQISAQRSEVPQELMRRHRAQTFRRKDLLAYAAAAVAAVGLLWALTPWLSRRLAVQVPMAWERKAGEAFEHLPMGSASPSNDAHRALEAAAQRLVANLPEGSRLAFRIRVDCLGPVNAFALPGGLIIVSSSLIQKAETSDEVVGVLAHEIQHVLSRHVLAGIIRGSILTTVWALAIGDYTGFLAIDPSTVASIAALQFSRDDELEADRGAVAMLKAAGISRKGFADFFSRLRKTEGAIADKIPELISTHPTNQKRIDLILNSELPSEKNQPALSPAEWTAIREACKPK